jgi:hypothetical protein
MRPRHPFACALVLAALLPACGGDRPTAPAPLRPAEIPAGTVLTVVAGDSDRPIPGATVVLADRRYTTGAAGEARLEAPVMRGTAMDVVADGYLDRQTTVRDGETRFSLWPKSSPTGLDEHATAELVYTPGGQCCPAETLAGQALRRVAPTLSTLTLVIDPKYRDRPPVRAAVAEGAGIASAAVGGRVAFVIGEAQSGPHVYITTGPDPANRENVAAFTERTFNSQGYITGGRVVFVLEDYLAGPQSHRTRTTLMAHELGHVLGLGHSSRPGVMGRGTVYSYFAAHGDFSPAEKLVLDLMSQRRAGTRFPDNDRTAALSAGPGYERVSCAF